jgi:hypothetical protein
VVKEVVAIASTLGLRAAAIDLDWLGRTTGATVGVDELIARNLTAVAGTYAAAGIDHFGHGAGRGASEWSEGSLPARLRSGS